VGKDCRGERGVKIHAYKIVSRGNLSLDQVLTYIAGLPLEDRIRLVSSGEMRLEAANKTGQIWSLDFGGMRSEGPGRASRARPITDFDLGEDEAFGEETAAIFNISTGFMALQYNHRGPRQSRIQGYLFRFARLIAGLDEDVRIDDENGFILQPILKSGAIERFRRAAIVKSLTLSVFVPGLSQVEVPERRRQSLSGLLRDPIVGGAESLKFEIRASRRRVRL
jgi:uncharacterized protein DUF6731